MRSFFVKKQYLVDLLDGFIDIHNHILPGIDDGAKNVEASIALIRALGNFGINHFVCTPHVMHNYYDNTPETINDALQHLTKTLKKLELSINISASAEYMIDDRYEDLLETQEILPFKQHLLIEMSFVRPPVNLEHALQQTEAYGYYPILAHPERYLFYKNDDLQALLSNHKKLCFQTNLLSFTGYYGKMIKRRAFELLDLGLVGFVGTDIHHLDQINWLQSCTLSQKKIEKLLPIIRNTNHVFH